jgi:hypothetical protein
MEIYATNSRPTLENARQAPKEADEDLLHAPRKERIPQRDRLATVGPEFEILETLGTPTEKSQKKMN